MMKRRFVTALAALSVLVLLWAPFSYAGQRGPRCNIDCKCLSAPAVQLNDGDVWVVEETTRLSKLTLAEGARITVPEGYGLTLTVNGVETGSVLVDTPPDGPPIPPQGITEIAPGTYQGCVVLTVAEENIVEFAPMGPSGAPVEIVTFPFRQALYLDEDGVVKEKSVLAAVAGKKRSRDSMKNVLIRSQGENFNGIFAADGTHTIKNTIIDFSGNGRSDFVGNGTAAMSTGEHTTLVLNRVRIVNRGVVRTAAVADRGSNLVVKNSYLQTYNGVLPEDYVPTVDMVQMRSVPWMLGLSGNNRATNLLGTHTKATYINSYIGSEGWGVLSTDACTTPQLTAINSTIANIGEDGYGSYGIGDAIERFLGCTLNVATYATICRDTFVNYADSDPEVVAQLNTDLELGLTARELKRIKKRPTIVNSKRFGVMWHGGGTVDISGGTIFNTGETTFLDKGQAIDLTVDGSEGARLNPGNGVILQVMDDDDPGPVVPDMTNTGVYTEPAGDVGIQAGHNIFDLNYGPNRQGEIGCTDARATFANIELDGDFYNAMRGDFPGPFGPPSPRNMAITLVNADITGLISASTATHGPDHLIIEYPVGVCYDKGEPYACINEGHEEDYRYLGVVTNTPGPVINNHGHRVGNNGVIVSLDANSSWTLTGTCYLTRLTVEEGSVVAGRDGAEVSMTLDGVQTPIEPGTYSGAIVLAID
jgi:hypothetical protein